MSWRLGSIRISAVISILFWGCGDGRPGDNQNQAGCPEGYRAEGPACVPIFDDPDDCPGTNEMPALGGGCRPVGVLQCATGFVADGEGACEPILPPSPGPGIDPCPPGTMEMIGHTDCQPVGVLRCAEGFVADGEGGCDAILPPGPDPCPPGTIEQLGHDTCQPLGDCGPDPSQGGSPWGLIAVDATTKYVDTTADASGANGTAAAPFPTIAAALTAAQPGGQVVIAAGEYEELLVLSKPVRLAGRCSALVILRGRVQVGQPRPALSITAGGTGSEVRGVTLTGPGVGLQVSGAQQVVVEEVEVRGTGSFGVDLQGETEANLGRVKVTGCSKLGIVSRGSTLHLDRSVVGSTLPELGTNAFGQGIQAFCSGQDACGSLRVERSLVTLNRGLGIFVGGVDTTVVSSVVRDTLPEASSQALGGGIGAQCQESLEICSSLRVEGSLVAGNRQSGIGASGVDVTVVSSVVRDTDAQESDETLGRGITAQCDAPLRACGSLLVEDSLVVGNREAGVSAIGVDARVTSSVVRNTRARLRDQTAGWGIAAQCDPGLEVCGSLLVERSLVTGSTDAGVISDGIAATVISSVVRDTRAQESDQKSGRGINVQCDEAAQVCGSLRVEQSLVVGNREFGIFAGGVEASVVSSVVRDTLARESDQMAGRGINAQCYSNMGVCGALLVEGCLVAGNREVGIAAFGVEVTVRSSVTRDTLPRDSDRTGGFGIAAQCYLDLGECGALTVEESLVTGNRAVAVIATGVDLVAVSSIVRDTRAQESDQAFGTGIAAQCQADTCGILRLEGSLVDANRRVGVFAVGVHATVVSSVVRDTLPEESEHALGRGINAQCDPDLGACGHLTVTTSLVTRSEDVGIFIHGVPAELQGVAVLDTRTNLSGHWAGEHGQGIWALCDPYPGACGTLSITSCLVAVSHGAGVALEGVSGFMTGSLVDTVLDQPLDGKYGYGIQIGGLEGRELPTFHVRESEIREAKLAGMLYFRSKGTLSASVVSGGEYSVAMNEGSSPTVAGDNQLSGTVKNDPQWVSLYPSPAPPPATPERPLEE